MFNAEFLWSELDALVQQWLFRMRGPGYESKMEDGELKFFQINHVR